LFDDTRKDHLSKIALDKSRVDLSSPIIFLCGGLVDITKPETLSVREALIEHIASKGCQLSDQITLAEEFKDWIHDGVYKDLLVFEDDIAHISSLIVIVLESPGALAELGLFVKNKILNKKIIVFVNEDHYSSDSFIKLGPLRYLQAIKERNVCAYPWDTDISKLDATIKDSLPEMRQDLLDAMDSQDKTEVFDMGNDGHISFLIFEIIKLYRALVFKEIESYIKEIGVELSREKAKRLLFLLEKFGLVKSIRRGHSVFFYAVSDINKINFGGHFDRNGARISAMQFYALNESESRRFRVIKTIESAGTGAGNATA